MCSARVARIGHAVFSGEEKYRSEIHDTQKIVLERRHELLGETKNNQDVVQHILECTERSREDLGKVAAVPFTGRGQSSMSEGYEEERTEWTREAGGRARALQRTGIAPPPVETVTGTACLMLVVWHLLVPRYMKCSM